jgi:uncharacterized protein
MRAITLGCATTIAALGIAPALAQDGPPPPPMLQGTMLDIAVEGASTRVPDIATINAGVVTQAATAAEAMRANSTQMARVLAALRGAGVAERDLRTAAIGLNPQYRYEDNKPPILTGYQATNQVTVRFRDIAKAGTILDALVSAGANSIDGPTLSIDKPDAAMDEARTDAVAKAKARAELYARAAGLHVDRIVSISEGNVRPPVVPMPMLMRTAAKADSATEIAPGEQQLTVDVTVRFLLK